MRQNIKKIRPSNLLSGHIEIERKEGERKKTQQIKKIMFLLLYGNFNTKHL